MESRYSADVMLVAIWPALVCCSSQVLKSAHVVLGRPLSTVKLVPGGRATKSSSMPV